LSAGVIAEKIGLLPVPRRTAGNYRSYGTRHLQQLGFIRQARELGFSIEDVRELLKLAAHAEEPCAEVDQLVAIVTLQEQTGYGSLAI